MTLQLLAIVFGAICAGLLVAHGIFGLRAIPRVSFVVITDGPHKGRSGTVVSHPWLGNLWHTWLQVNVPADGGSSGNMLQRREWLTVRAKQVKLVHR